MKTVGTTTPRALRARVLGVGIWMVALIACGAPTWTAVAIAWIVQGVLHLVYHIGHLDNLGSADTVGLVGSLTTIPVLALIALWSSLLGSRQATT